LCRRTMGSREEAFKPEMKMICWINFQLSEFEDKSLRVA
jgi:hypothetical protein